jgi:hypothetical protein
MSFERSNNMEESKSSVCKHLCETLKWTKEFQDLSYIKLEVNERGQDMVYIRFKDGHGYVMNATEETALEMMQRILKVLHVYVEEYYE